MQWNYWLAILFVFTVMFVLFVGLIRPWLEDPLLKAWYARQNTNWLTTRKQLVDSTLASFVRSRYVKVDSTNGTVTPLQCKNYLHIFPFTDLGVPLVVRFSEYGSVDLTNKRSNTRPETDLTVGTTLHVTQQLKLSYNQLKSYQLREYVVNECLDDVSRWRGLFKPIADRTCATTPTTTSLSTSPSTSEVISTEGKFAVTAVAAASAAGDVVGDASTDTVDDPFQSDRSLSISPDTYSAYSTYRKDKEATLATFVSALKRYDYKITYLPPPGSSLDNIPSSASAALQTSRGSSHTAAELTIEFFDLKENRRFKFRLPEYQKSQLANRVTTLAKTYNNNRHNNEKDSHRDISNNNVNELWSKLQLFELKRSVFRSVDQRRNADREAQDVLLFHKTLYNDESGIPSANSDHNSLLSTTLNPCWSASRARYVTGDFPVTAAQFSNIYMRGLQQISETEVQSDETVATNLRRLYWRCVWDYNDDSDNSYATDRNVTSKQPSSSSSLSSLSLPSSSSSVQDSGSSIAKRADTFAAQTSTISGNAVLYNTLLSLNLCADDKVFDGRTCV